MKVAFSAASPDCNLLVLDKDDNPLAELSPEVGTAHVDVPEAGVKLVPVKVKAAPVAKGKGSNVGE